MSNRAWLLLIANALIWGSSFLFIKVAVDGVTPSMLTFTRCLLGAAVMWVYIAARRKTPAIASEPGRRYTSRERLSLFTVAAMTGIPFTVFAWAEMHIASGVAGIANASTPIWSTLLAMRWDADHPGSRTRWLGVALGFFGVMLLLISEGLHGSTTDALAVVSLSLAALCYSIGGVVTRTHLMSVDSARVASYSCTIPAIVLALPAIHSLHGTLPPASSMVALVVLGIVPTGIGLLLYYRLLAMVGASRAAMVTYLMPPLAVTYGAVFLGETVTIVAVAAMAIILTGVWVGSLDRGARGAELEP